MMLNSRLLSIQTLIICHSGDNGGVICIVYKTLLFVCGIVQFEKELLGSQIFWDMLLNTSVVISAWGLLAKRNSF